MTEEQDHVFYAAALLLAHDPNATVGPALSTEEAVQRAIKLHAEVHRATDPRLRYANLPEGNRPDPTTGRKP